MKKFLIPGLAGILILAFCFLLFFLSPSSGIPKTPDEETEREKTASADVCSESCSDSIEKESNLPFLPDPEPFFEQKAPRTIRPEFHVDSFTYQPYGAKEIKRFDLPYFQAGNKKAAVRLTDNGMNPTQDQGIFFHVDGKAVARIVWWGAHKGGFGYPFADQEDAPAELEINREQETIQYSKTFHFEDGTPGTFIYKLRRATPEDTKAAGNQANPENLLVLSWEVIGPKETLDALAPNFGVSLWLIACGNNYRNKVLTFGGEEFHKTHRSALMQKKENYSFHGDFVYDAPNPAHSFRLGMGDLRGGLEETLRVTQTQDFYGFVYRVQNSIKKQILIDFGECLEPAKTMPSVNGHDFWTADALDVAQPPCRNQMRNPSFEQGFRYWRWTPGGARYTHTDVPHYRIVPQGLFGQNAVEFTNFQYGVPSLQCFPMGLKKGQTYTLSFYAKTNEGNGTITVAPASGGNGGQFPWLKELSNPLNHYKTSSEWQRFSRTFVDDGAGVMLNISGSANTLIDAIQIEEGDAPTDFVTAPIEGFLETANPDDDFELGEPMNASLVCVGDPGIKGSVRVVLRNAFREILFDRKFNVELQPESPDQSAEKSEDGSQIQGLQRIPLELDAIRETLGQGVFCIETVYSVNGVRQFNDFHRLTIMKKLNNTHRTKNVFGNLSAINTVSRGDDLARKYREWGFGSSSWGNANDVESELPRMMRENRILNFYHSVSENGTPEVREQLHGYKEWTEVTPEMEALIEQNAFEQVSRCPKDLFPVWGFGNEEEGCVLIRGRKFDEYFKAQHAAAKGALRANPEAIIVPTCGTSGYSLLRGYDAVEGYLAASVRHNFRYGAIAVHPYWNLDGGTLGGLDLDEETTRLRDQMARYGYGPETPIFYTECFNIPGERFPNWGLDLWGDTWLYGRLSYDFGNREFVQAASAARLYIICLKYFPQLQHANVWRSVPFMDLYLTPYLLCKGVNTLGNLMGDVAYFADVKPFPNIRGYAFRLPDGRGIVPLWCIDANVENAQKRGPILRAKLPKDTQFLDFMGNPRQAHCVNGLTEIPLTCAPMFLISSEPLALAEALQKAESSDSKGAVQVEAIPQKDGTMTLSLTNRTGSVQRGILRFEDAEKTKTAEVAKTAEAEKTAETAKTSVSYVLAPSETKAFRVPDFQANTTPCTLNRWNAVVSLIPETSDANSDVNSDAQTFQLARDFFYVPRSASDLPNWKSIPKLELSNRYCRSAGSGPAPTLGKNEDLGVSIQATWLPASDEKDAKLWVRILVTDDELLEEPQFWNEPKAQEQLYFRDGCAMLYFDCGANAKRNLQNGKKGFDLDDYRYDIALPKDLKSKKAPLWRMREVNHQFADGLDMPTREEASRQIPVQFQRTRSGFRYTVEFGQRFLNPFTLQSGSRAGFGLMLHDRDASKPENSIPQTRGLSNASDVGLGCENNPHLFPEMILLD